MSETNKPKTKLDWLIIGANWAAILIVTIATGALIWVVSSLIRKEPENIAPKEIVVKYEISVDTSLIKNDKDSATIKSIKNLDENNKKILSEINSSVDAQYKRMESILSVQEDRSKLFSYGAGFLAILVAIATFFGFKSINEMKKGTIDTAEYEARKIAEEEAKKVAEEIAKEVAEVKAKEVATETAKEVAEIKAKEIATETSKTIAEKEAKEIATETSKTIAEKEAKTEVRDRLKDIKKQLKSNLERDFKDKFEERELKVSDEWANNLKGEIEVNLKKILEDLESIEERVQQIESLHSEPFTKTEDHTSKEEVEEESQIQKVNIDTAKTNADDNKDVVNEKIDVPNESQIKNDSETDLFNDDDLTK
ncbi:hypothetical protein ACFOWU_09365 [Epilithonimonas zeae]|uniref:Uncharacterized protein n=1 Tax=Epilithonimonas zeae TaxID=1416779 RepID=A0A1N6GNN9_9FLAO|nr:hypothetical protein [Epilithonimonas zeae]SIO09134.1 hypothetical protein SAMN05444409_1956 [Epilithonimonas zeae]